MQGLYFVTDSVHVRVLDCQLTNGGEALAASTVHGIYVRETAASGNEDVIVSRNKVRGMAVKQPLGIRVSFACVQQGGTP